MIKNAVILFSLILLGLSQSIFSPDSDVITLNSQNFEKKVLNSNDNILKI